MAVELFALVSHWQHPLTAFTLFGFQPIVSLTPVEVARIPFVNPTIRSLPAAWLPAPLAARGPPHVPM